MDRILSKNCRAVGHKRPLLTSYCSQDFISGSITFIKHEIFIYVPPQGRVMYVFRQSQAAGVSVGWVVHHSDKTRSLPPGCPENWREVEEVQHRKYYWKWLCTKMLRPSIPWNKIYIKFLLMFLKITKKLIMKTAQEGNKMYAAHWYSTMHTRVFVNVFVQKKQEGWCYVAKT